MLATAFIFMVLTAAWAQPIKVSGIVKDASDGSPLIGASVYVEGTVRGTVTNSRGGYSMEAKMGDVLVFSFIGYVSEKKVVKSATLHAELRADEQILQECVVVGFGKTKSPRMSATKSLMRSASFSYDAANTEAYKSIEENGFKQVKKNPLSTFSMDVDAASYSNMRRYLNQGKLPPADAIRTEELVNYFTYHYPKPTGSDPVKISTEVGSCPWESSHRLVRIGLKAKEIPSENLPASNLVFLIDVSGSMFGPTRLDLVVSSLKLLVDNLREKDRVAIVTYSGNAGLALPSTQGNDKQKIKEALEKLTAGGSTAGGEGIQLAYKIARQNLITNGNNRIILCTDGDFNVGVSSEK